MTRLAVNLCLSFWHCSLVTCGIAVLCGGPADAITFENVVSLGDSLLDDNSGTRSPVVAEHIADALGSPWTNLAVSGATSGDLLAQGQHTSAASLFGTGDLAVLWIGGNDFFQNSLSIAFGGFGFLNSLESNVSTALGTLRGAGMEVVVLNLLDMSKVPAVINIGLGLGNFREATLQWRSRLNALALTHDATVIDAFDLYEQLTANPHDFAILGQDPILGPAIGCQFCLFADSIHPSSVAQGFVANESIATMNEDFDPTGVMPLDLLSHVQLASLVGIDAGDFDLNGVYEVADIDILVQEIVAMTGNLAFDLTGDRQVNGDDLEEWRAVAGAANLASGNAYLVGDANLDGVVDGSDFGQWNAAKFSGTGRWSEGDFNADGVTDGADFNLWNANKFGSAQATSVVPEPGGYHLVWLMLTVGLIARSRSA